MKEADIMEVVTLAVEETIMKKWRHDGFIGGFSSGYSNFEVDGKEYVLVLHEVKDGEHWSDKLE